MRWWTVARLLRFGINVAQWDVDLTIHGDMYQYFKSEPMEGIHWLCGCEGTCRGIYCNGGTCYYTETTIGKGYPRMSTRHSPMLHLYPPHSMPTCQQETGSV